MGGDFAPGPIVEGVVAAARALPISVRLVGQASALEAELSKWSNGAVLDVTIVDAPEVVGMSEAPTAGPAAQAGRLDSRGGAAGGRRTRLGDCLGRQHRRHGDGGAHRAWA